jgi:type IV pilus assembly protein PilX
MPVVTKAHFRTDGYRRQRGAALVVALLLLLVITLLAVAGMNSAAVEFVMAGNEQHRQTAFQAAETGIEQTLVTGGFIPAAADEVHNNVAVPNSTTDTYSATLHSDLGGAAQPAIWGNSWNSFSTYDFTVTSTGNFLANSVRGAQSTHSQGIAVLAPASAQTSGAGGLN